MSVADTVRRITFIVVIGAAFVLAGLASPYLPYPARYCAKHPGNSSCLAYAPRSRAW